MVRGKKVIVSKKPIATKRAGTYTTTKMTKAERASLSKYLTGMGVDPGLVPLMEKTPPSDIHPLTASELTGLRVVTTAEQGETLLDPKLCALAVPAAHCVAR